MKTPSLIAVSMICALLGASSAAQELPDVFHVADRVGQQVEFQDEVKALSYSRSTNGFYLNFGGAFPAQVISVWASNELYVELSGGRGLVGRTVRVSGLLEKNPTGLLIKLQTKEQFQLLRADEGVLSKQDLDGKLDRDQFMAAVRQLFARGDFETLEVLAEELRQSRERFADGLWLSAAYLHAFDLPGRVAETRLETFQQRLGQWERARPGSLVRVLVAANFHIDRAWRARGSDFANKVTPEGWIAFRKELADARQLLESYPAAKMYPQYYELMQSIALGQSWKKDEYFRLFAEATALEPDYYDFYFKAARYLLPQWRGRKGEWEEFAERQRQQRGAGAAGDAIYARIVWAMKGNDGDVFRDSPLSWATVASGFDHMLREYPNSRFLKNAYAKFAWRAGDRVRLRNLLGEIRNDPDMTIWVNLENLGFAEKAAARN